MGDSNELCFYTNCFGKGIDTFPFVLRQTVRQVFYLAPLRKRKHKCPYRNKGSRQGCSPTLHKTSKLRLSSRRSRRTLSVPRSVSSKSLTLACASASWEDRWWSLSRRRSVTRWALGVNERLNEDQAQAYMTPTLPGVLEWCLSFQIRGRSHRLLRGGV